MGPRLGLYFNNDSYVCVAYLSLGINMTCNIENVEVGDYYSRHSYGKVVDRSRDAFLVENEEGLQWGIPNEIFEKEFLICDRAAKVEKVTRTELTDIIKENARVIMRVCFRKQPVHKEVVTAIKNIPEGITDRKYSMYVKEAIKGPQRKMVGRHYNAYDGFGRLSFVDMEATDGHPRLVDPRTIEWALIGQTKYEVK